MKLSLAVFALALVATTLARSPFAVFRREPEGESGPDEKAIQKIESEVDKEIIGAEVLAKDIAEEEHKEKDGDIAICALELLGDIGHSFESIFEEKGGKDDDDHDDDDDDDDEGGEGEGGEILEKLGTALVKRMLRLKRSPQEEFEPTEAATAPPSRYGTGGPSWGPSRRPSGRPQKCEGALEKFFRCMKVQLGKLDDKKGEGKGEEEGEGESELLRKRKFHKLNSFIQ